MAGCRSLILAAWLGILVYGSQRDIGNFSFPT